MGLIEWKCKHQGNEVLSQPPLTAQPAKRKEKTKQDKTPTANKNTLHLPKRNPRANKTTHNKTKQDYYTAPTQNQPTNKQTQNQDPKHHNDL